MPDFLSSRSHCVPPPPQFHSQASVAPPPWVQVGHTRLRGGGGGGNSDEGTDTLVLYVKYHVPYRIRCLHLTSGDILMSFRVTFLSYLRVFLLQRKRVECKQRPSAVLKVTAIQCLAGCFVQSSTGAKSRLLGIAFLEKECCGECYYWITNLYAFCRLCSIWLYIAPICER